jgi:hypothetical protein
MNYELSILQKANQRIYRASGSAEVPEAPQQVQGETGSLYQNGKPTSI